MSDLRQRAADLFRDDPALAWAVVAESKRRADYLSRQWEIAGKVMVDAFRQFGEVVTDLYENDPEFRAACLELSHGGGT